VAIITSSQQVAIGLGFLLPFCSMAKRPHYLKVLGENIRSAREKAKWSQEQLAEKAQLNRNYIGEIERAEKRSSLEALRRIAKALGVPMVRLFRGL